MRLEMATFDVKDIVFSDKNALVDGILHIHKGQLLEYLTDNSPFYSLEIGICRPGESVRIVHPLDVVEPRTKTSSHGQIFPGLLGPSTGAGEGRTIRLNGIAVIGVANPFAGEDGSGPWCVWRPGWQVVAVARAGEAPVGRSVGVWR